MTGIRQAGARIAAQRMNLWLVRSDLWPVGEWRVSADPYAPGIDWKAKIHGSRAHIRARYAAEQGEIDRRDNNARQTQNLKQLRTLVDKMRQSAG